MYFLNKEFSELIEAETTCSFNQDYLVMELFKHVTFDEVFNVFKEEFVFNRDKTRMRLQLFSYTNELLNATLLAELSYLFIKFFGSHSTLIDIT